jgi:hypothetical protein
LIRKPFLALSWALLPCVGLMAQVRWKNVDTSFDSLPSSLHVFLTKDSLDGAPFLAYYASVKLKDEKLDFTVLSGDGNSYTPEQYYHHQSKPPVLVVNGPFFSFESNRILSLLIRNGKIISYHVNALKGSGPDSAIYYYPTRSALGISRRRKADVAWIFTDSMHSRPYAFEEAPVIARGREPSPSIYDLGRVDWAWWEMHTAVGGGPTLIHDGKIRITSKEEQMFGDAENDRTPRTAMGYTSDGRLIILVIQGRYPGLSDGATLFQEATILKNLGCYEALNLDGGGSSYMLVQGKETIQPSDHGIQRPVPAVFMIRKVEK